MWQQIGNYEYEYDFNTHSYTGWYRCVGGMMTDGKWPQWNYNTGKKS